MPLILKLVKSQLLWKEYQWSILSVLHVTYNMFRPSGRYVFVFSSMFNALEGDNEEKSAKWTLPLRGITIDESESIFIDPFMQERKGNSSFCHSGSTLGREGQEGNCGALWRTGNSGAPTTTQNSRTSLEAISLFIPAHTFFGAHWRSLTPSTKMTIWTREHHYKHLLYSFTGAR